MTPSCCLNPLLTKMSHQHCRAGGEQPPVHVAEIRSLVAALRGGRGCQDGADLLDLHMGLWDLSTLQLLGSPARLTRVAGVTQQCWLGSPDGRSHRTIQQCYFQHPQQHLCTAPACSSGCAAHPRSPIQPHTPPCRNSINTCGVQHQLQCSEDSQPLLSFPVLKGPQQRYFCHNKALKHQSFHKQT